MGWLQVLLWIVKNFGTIYSLIMALIKIIKDAQDSKVASAWLKKIQESVSHFKATKDRSLIDNLLCELRSSCPKRP